MLKLNRTTEYGLMALAYIRNKKSSEKLSSAREIADFYHLPFEILAKTLQKLKENGVINSIYGTRGGYTLAKELNEINLAEFIGFMEGSNGVVGCLDIDSTQDLGRDLNKTSCHCEYHNSCGIKDSMRLLNKKMYDFLSRINLAELTQSQNVQSITPDLTSPIKYVAMSGEEP